MNDFAAPSGFDGLWDRYPWPSAPPVPDAPLSGRDPVGLDLVTNALGSLDKAQPVVLEIGAEFGGSTRAFLALPGVHVVSVDPWPDSYGAGSFPELRPFLGRPDAMYELFQTFTFEDRARLAMVRDYSPAGPITVHDAGVEVDLVYVDGDHRYDSVLHDLTINAALFPGALLAGNDWLFNPANAKYEGIRFPVQTAVRRFAAVRDVHVEVGGDTWMLDPSRRFNLDRPVPRFTDLGGDDHPAETDLPGRIKLLERTVAAVDRRSKTAEKSLVRIEKAVGGLPTARILRKVRSVVGGRS